MPTRTLPPGEHYSSAVEVNRKALALHRRHWSSMSLTACLGLAVLVAACVSDATTAASTAATSVQLASHGNSDIPPQAQRRLGVMTYNLYLGADVGPVIAAPPGQVIQAAADAWAHVQATDFRIRAEAIARAIAGQHPELVGLEEVSLWETSSSPSGPFTTAYDFLQLVLDELAKKGTPYRAVAVNPHFGVMLPVTQTFDSWVRWTERNAIIARADVDGQKVFTSNPVSRIFQAYIPLTLLGQPLPITRGYATVDVQFRGKWVRFVAAHLEAYSDVVRKLQAAELATTLASSPYDVILVGDLNSQRTFSGDSWQIFAAAGYTDVWTETMPGVPGYTSSFGDDLVGPPSELDHTVDYVLRRSVPSLLGIAGAGEVVGDEIADQTTNGWWPSDHAGVFAVVRINVKE